MESIDITAISTLISTVGFPIAACCALFYLYNKTLSKLTSTLEKIDSTLDRMSDRIDALERELHSKS